MSAYQNWTRQYARDLVRRELMDTTGRWWTDEWINSQLENWMTELQEQFEFVWTTSTYTTALSTITLSSLSPQISRLDAVYWIGTGGGRGYRLAGRLLEDLERAHTEWRSATPDNPREIIQYDSTRLTIWPPLANTSTIIFEAPKLLSFVDDNSPIQLPVWTQWSLKPYVCFEAYLRPGPTNDLPRALRYKAQYEKEIVKIKTLWDNYLPERYRKLKPASCYDWDIIFPPAAQVSGNPTFPDNYTSYIPIGDVDGVNTLFTLAQVPTTLRLFKNGILMLEGSDYILNLLTIIFVEPPLTGDTLIAWIYLQGVN